MMIATQDETFAAKHRLDSWSQEGEDLVLRRFFEGQKTGFYVDVGAHHPHRFSNTYFFYKRGWRGINIDAMPGSMQAFREHRPDDINVEAAISDEMSMTYFAFGDSALNGLCRELSEDRDHRGFKIISRSLVRTRRLADVLEEHLPSCQAIDFLTIDVEGHDLSVLKSNNWSKDRPRFVLAEDLDKLALDQLDRSTLVTFMRGQGYAPCARTFNTLFFKNSECRQ